MSQFLLRVGAAEYEPDLNLKPFTLEERIKVELRFYEEKKLNYHIYCCEALLADLENMPKITTSNILGVWDPGKR